MKMTLTCAALGVAAVVAILDPVGTNDAQSQTGRGSASQLCHANASPIYSCQFGSRRVTVCGYRGAVSYNFSNNGRTELHIPYSGEVHRGTVVGQGGGHQEHLRFTNEGTQYIVYRGVNGRLADRPGHRYSGLTVMRGNRTLSHRRCATPRVSSSWDAIGILPQEPENSPYDAWF